ncbi:hypothetical protein CGZ94_21360 [Enemella evansiae]|uniref:Uncharacterized protein n=1 Tax=Enemella evansiae TaxID=2016499 RepID=A0A255FWE9_9ACTN|nr:hypothetical protein [Enemella evansiae]OYO07995.1 hypothetical protein CGZ94_21360 [Enemella evansiae]
MTERIRDIGDDLALYEDQQTPLRVTRTPRLLGAAHGSVHALGGGRLTADDTLAPYNPAAAERINDSSPRFRIACRGQIPVVDPRAVGMRGRMPSGPVPDRYPEHGGRAGRSIADRRMHRC